MNNNRAIFLDRDGTINEETGYIDHVNRFKIFPFVADSIKMFRKKDFKIFVVTNQSGIARGYFSEEVLNEIHKKLLNYLSENGTSIDAIYYCPHHPTEGKGKYTIDCNCRKPKTGMIDQAVKEYDIDLSNSYMIGDRFKDIQFAKSLNMKSGFLFTGYGKGEYEYLKNSWNFMPDLIAENLKEMAKKITKNL
jgi:D-glycero-D-manno-heptose 1,7-bisphosphate phosphatase